MNRDTCHQKNVQLNHQKGFTLVEITLAITIIALLIVAISTGADIQQKIRLKDINDDIDSYAEAVSTFEDTYSSIPGDMWNAESTFGVTAVGNKVDEAPSAGDGNGDGDSTLETNLTSPARNETLLFWQHLAAAGIIQGDFDVSSSQPSTGVPKGPFKNSGYYASTSGTSILITLSRYDIGATASGYGQLTPREAYDIDAKYDDGDPSAGKVTAADGTGETAGTCASGSNYTLTNTDKHCTITFTIAE